MSLKEKAPIISFVFSSIFFAYLWGFVTGSYKFFPYPVFQSAKGVFNEFISNKGESATKSGGPQSLHSFHYRENYVGGGITISVPEQSYQGYTLFTAFDGDKCVNRLIDNNGNTIQEWFIKYSEVWGNKAPFLQEQFGDEWTCWHGTELSSNGDLIASFTDNGRPYCGGLVKLNKYSEIVWSLPECTHHDVHIAEDGLIYAPSMTLLEEPPTNPAEANILRYLSPRRSPLATPEEQSWEYPLLAEEIVILTQDGELIDKVQLLESFANSDYRSIHSTQYQVEKHSGDSDPTHTNDIEVITEAWAKHHPKIQAGDLMISVRNMNAIAIIDRSTKKIKWVTSGPFIRHHDPDLLDNGNLLIFDNWGTTGSKSGASRVIEWNPKTQEIVWEYGGTPENPLHTTFRGSQQLLPNGNILITETVGGRILEVTRSGEIVWEYINKLDGNKVGAVIRAQRFSPEDLEFVTEDQ